jgi:DNA invertase Pin-like site-specific DNA recombinase
MAARMTSETDFVAVVIDTLRYIAPGLPEEKTVELERRLRHDWGGERPYIAKRPNDDSVKARAAAALSQGMSVPEAQRRFGISRSRAYRIKSAISKPT